jgi:hypothetical protein
VPIRTGFHRGDAEDAEVGRYWCWSLCLAR